MNDKADPEATVPPFNEDKVAVTTFPVLEQVIETTFVPVPHEIDAGAVISDGRVKVRISPSTIGEFAVTYIAILLTAPLTVDEGVIVNP